MGRVHAWPNGNDLAENTDGLIGFELEVTKHLRAGLNLIAIRVDNSHGPKILLGKRLPDNNVYGGLWAFAIVGKISMLKSKTGICQLGKAPRRF